jgi:hypothetical protein
MLGVLDTVVVGAGPRLRVVGVGKRGELDGLLSGEVRVLDCVAIEQLRSHAPVIGARGVAPARGGVGPLEVLWVQPGPVGVHERAAPAGKLAASRYRRYAGGR